MRRRDLRLTASARAPGTAGNAQAARRTMPTYALKWLPEQCAQAAVCPRSGRLQQRRWGLLLIALESNNFYVNQCHTLVFMGFFSLFSLLSPIHTVTFSTFIMSEVLMCRIRKAKGPDLHCPGVTWSLPLCRGSGHK